MDIELAVLIGAMSWTAVSFLKYLRAAQYWDAATLAVVVGVSVAVAFLVKAAGFALAGANAAEVVVVGYMAGSVSRSLYELKKAIDTSDSAKEPKLFTAPHGD
jgi:hypothetical protein